MRRDFRSTLGHAAMVTCFSLLVISGCSKEKDSDDTAASPSLAGGNAGVETTTGNDLSLAGQLAISGLELASTTKGILVFSLVKGQVNGKPVKIEVDENGIFNVPIKRADEAIDALLAQLELPRDSRNWSEMAKTIQEGLGMTDVTQEMLESMPEEQLIEGVKGLALDNKEGGLMTLLVAYEISPDGDKVAEAQSFRFISLPTASSGSLGALPNKDLKGNISLGKITGEGSNVISELQANDALDLGASAIDTLASTGNTLKLVKNVYINDKWNVTPFYAWRGAAKSTVIDQFSNVESSTYKGYGTYIPSARNIDVAHTFEDFCGGKSLTFTAPADIDVIVENTPAQKAISFDNSNPEERSQGDSRVCIAGSSMYLREDVRDGKTSFMLNFGSGGSFQNSPEGLWKLAIDGTEEAWFD